MTKFRLCLYGLSIGITNALFGAGSGIISVTVLDKAYNDQKKAQATTMAVILPITIITAIRYINLGYVTVSNALPYIIPGFVGAIIGSAVLKKSDNRFMKAAFSLIMLFAGIRMIFK